MFLGFVQSKVAVVVFARFDREKLQEKQVSGMRRQKFARYIRLRFSTCKLICIFSYVNQLNVDYESKWINCPGHEKSKEIMISREKNDKGKLLEGESIVVAKENTILRMNLPCMQHLLKINSSDHGT